MTTQRPAPRPLAIVACLVTVLASSVEARAWTFPEHMELTRLALEDHAPGGVADALALAVEAARRLHLPLCRHLQPPLSTLPLDDLRLSALTAPSVQCIPYTALPALAGDHAVDAAALWKALTTRIGRPAGASNPTLAAAVTGAAAVEWRFLLEGSSSDVPRVWTSAPRGNLPTTLDPGRDVDAERDVHPRDFVRKLDARLLLVDSEYAVRANGSRAHFPDATASVEQLLRRLVTTGDAENALAQMLAHHIVSLKLALRARAACPASPSKQCDDLLALALFEHALAVHFVQDAFSAGHLATDPSIHEGQARLRRHDHFNRIGLVTARSIGATRCGRNERRSDLRELPACWMAYGDGYASYQDRLHVGDATARLQLQFALALSPSLADALRSRAQCPSWCDPPPERDAAASPHSSTVACTAVNDVRATEPSGYETCDLWRAAQLLDPFPTWTFTDEQLQHHVTSRSYALKLVDSAAAALVVLDGRRFPFHGPATDNRAAAWERTDPSVVGDPLHPCRERSAGAKFDFELDHPCMAELLTYQSGVKQAGGQIRFEAFAERMRAVPSGHVDIALWRPLLVAWPAPQTEVTALQGADAFGRGWAFQVLALGNATGRPNEDVQGYPSLGVSFGVAYRWDALLPHRNNRALAELNVGVSQAVMLPQRQFLTFGTVELRAPVITALILAQSYMTKSSGMLDAISQRWGFGLFGVRGYLLMHDDTVSPAGWDAEIAYLVTARPDYSRGAARQGVSDAELRLRLGMFDFSLLTKPGEVAAGSRSYGFAMGLEFAGGYGWFF